MSEPGDAVAEDRRSEGDSEGDRDERETVVQQEGEEEEADEVRDLSYDLVGTSRHATGEPLIGCR